jgi:hypothetical protein
MVTVDVLLATFVTDRVIPVGAEVGIVPAESEYQATVPDVPVAMFVVVAAKVALPAVPLVIVPDCTPRLTVGWSTVSVAIDETAEANVVVK